MCACHVADISPGEVDVNRDWARRIASPRLQLQQQTEEVGYRKGDASKQESGILRHLMAIIPARRFQSSCWLFGAVPGSAIPVKMMSFAPSDFLFPDVVSTKREPHIDLSIPAQIDRSDL